MECKPAWLQYELSEEESERLTAEAGFKIHAHLACSISFPTKQTQQVWSAVHLGHRRVWVFAQDLGILRPLELVQQLSAQHDVEVLSNPRHHFINGVLPMEGRKKR